MEEQKREGLQRRADTLKNIEKMIHEVGSIFQRIGSITKMQEQMVDRIDKDTDDTLLHLEKGKGHLIEHLKDVSSKKGLFLRLLIILMVFAPVYIVFFA